MDNQNYYILIGDDCENCLYVSNAFTLLRLPLKKIPLKHIDENYEAIHHAISVITCKNMIPENLDKLHKLLSPPSLVPLISFDEPNTTSKARSKSIYYLPMPFTIKELKIALCQSADIKSKILDPHDYTNPIFERLVGQSQHMCKIKSMIKQVANCDSNVLILGQSGTGKEIIASCIHHLSSRHDKPLVPINCGAIPSELMESELFGHEKGAFTGALTRRAGRFEMANMGTLFLDEIGDMPLPMQVKLLRVLQDRKIERVGSNVSIEVDVRLIAATNKSLEELIKNNQFREDLFYRLNVFPIHVPSLAERADDIPFLIEYYLDKIQERLNHRVVFTDRAMELLCQYSWPGNIRELANYLERMVILHQDRVIDEKDIDTHNKKADEPINELTTLTAIDHPFNIKQYIAKIEQYLIKSALEQSDGKISIAADYLSLANRTLLQKMKKYNLLHS